MAEDAQASGPDAHGPAVASEAPARASSVFAREFDIYRTVSDEDYRAVLTTGLVVLDTNTLLDLYRYHVKTRDDLIDVLRSLRGRVWVPHHAICEFFEGRLTVINSRNDDLRQATESIEKGGSVVEQALRTWTNRVGLSPQQADDMAEGSGIRSAIAILIEQVRDIGADSAFENADDTARDPVIAALSEILEDGVGEPLPGNELREARKIGLQRIADRVPPGWKDASKRENKEGDYLVWYQTLQEAKRRGSDVLFVTSEVKEDWWRIEHGEVRGPLPALMREMREMASVRLFMLRPASLLVHAGKALGIEVSTESVRDAERVSVQAATAWRIPDQRSEPTARAYVQRWHYTPSGFDVGTLVNLSNKAFSHPSYMRPYEQKLPAVRVGSFVACEPLTGDDITAEYLRSQLLDSLFQRAMLDLIRKFTDWGQVIEWQAQPGRGRFNLEADLLIPGSDRALASVLLLMPEKGMPRYGTDPQGAELYLHVDIPLKNDGSDSGAPEAVSLREWYERFTAALLLPGILARFLESIGLKISDEPATRFAIEIEGRVVNQLGIEELVNFGDLKILTPRRHSVQFDGWAVADPEGKSAGALSKRLLTELCESVGRTGYGSILADFPD